VLNRTEPNFDTTISRVLGSIPARISGIWDAWSVNPLFRVLLNSKLCYCAADDNFIFRYSSFLLENGHGAGPWSEAILPYEHFELPEVSFQRGVDRKVESIRDLEHAQVECLSYFGESILYRVPEHLSKVHEAI